MIITTAVRNIILETIDKIEKPIVSESYEWRKLLEETVDKLIEAGQSTLANEVSNVLSEAIGDAAIEARCYADFLRDRAVEQLRNIIGDRKKRMPYFCRPEPEVIDMSLSPERRASIKIYGYNLDETPVRVFLVDVEGRREDVTLSLAVPSPYLLTLDLGRHGVPLTGTSDRLEFELQGGVALRTANGQYVCAEGGGGADVVANRNAPGPWETFEVVNRGGNRVAIRAHNGQYVCAEGGGGQKVVANRDALGAWETFEMVVLDGGNRVAIRAHNGQYVCAEGGGGQELVANREQIGAWEIFQVMQQLSGHPLSVDIIQPHHQIHAQNLIITGKADLKDAGPGGESKTFEIAKRIALTPGHVEERYDKSWQVGKGRAVKGQLDTTVHLDPSDGSVRGDGVVKYFEGNPPVQLRKSETFQFALNSGSKWQKTITLTDEHLLLPSDHVKLVLSFSNEKCEYVWVPASEGHIPRGAEAAGREGYGNPPLPLYAVRAAVGGGMHPGKIRPEFKSAHVPYGGKEVTVDSYEVLVGPLKWVAATGGDVPSNAFQAGYEADGTPLFIARAAYDGGLHVGKIRKAFGGAYIPCGGREVKIGKYEVLIC